MKKREGIKVKSSKEFTIRFDETFVVPLKQFGFIPEILLIQRLKGSRFILSAVIGDKQAKQIKEVENINKAQEEVIKMMKEVKK